MATPDERYISAHEIRDGLWLGNQAASQSAAFCRAQGITLVINATRHIPCPHRHIRYYRVSVNDPGPASGANLAPDVYHMAEVLPSAVALLHAALRRGERVLVHCHAGAQRSAIIVAAFLASQRPGSPRERFNYAVNEVISRRPVAFFGGQSINFDYALRQYLLTEPPL